MQKLFFKFDNQEILNIIEALTVYKNYVLPKNLRLQIDKQLQEIDYQLAIQKVDLYVQNDPKALKFGDAVIIDDIDGYKHGYLLHAADTESFMKVIVNDNNLPMKIIEVPINLIKKRDD